MRWRLLGLRRRLRPANRPPLDEWVATEGRTLGGLIINVGSGEDQSTYGRRVIRVDAFAPSTTVRANFARGLPFCDEAFDGAICTEVLEHVSDAQLLLAELIRVLKPGARMLVSIPFCFHYHNDPADYLRLTPPGLEVELRRAGFQIDFIAGLGNKFTTLLLLLESVHPVAKGVIRVVVLALGPALRRQNPRPGKWSDWAANAVAIARKTPCAHR